MDMSLLSDQVDQKEIEIILREFKKVLDKNVEGDVVEFGCYLGTTSVFLADLLKKSNQNKKFYVYDSFEGLPEKTKEDASALGNSFKVGELLASKKQFIKNIKRANVPIPIIKKAWFNELSYEDVPDKISFAFLDGDYYSSIHDSLRLIEKKLVSRSVVIIDDYGNSALPGAKRATDKWLLKNPFYTVRLENSLAIIRQK